MALVLLPREGLSLPSRRTRRRHYMMVTSAAQRRLPSPAVVLWRIIPAIARAGAITLTGTGPINVIGGSGDNVIVGDFRDNQITVGRR